MKNLTRLAYKTIVCERDIVNTNKPLCFVNKQLMKSKMKSRHSIKGTKISTKVQNSII